MNQEVASQLAKLDFLRNWGEEARRGLINRPLGRDREIADVFSILSQKGKASVMLLGPPGIGKTAIVEGIACDLASGSLPPQLAIEALVELNVAALMSGTTYRGQLEGKVTELLRLLRRTPGIVVFIDEVHMLLGAGRTMDGGAASDVSQAIKPALALGEFCCVAATTDGEYDQHVAPDGAFCRRFHYIHVGTLTDDAVLEVLARKNAELRFTKGFYFGREALRAFVDYSNAHMPERYQPDKALDVLKRAAATCEKGLVHHTGGAAREMVPLRELRSSLLKQAELLAAGDSPQAGLTASKTLGLKPNSGNQVDISAPDLARLMASAR